MILDPGVVRGTLKRVVDRGLETQLLRRLHEVSEIVQCAQLRFDRGMAAVLVADRPRAAGIVGAGDETVVAAFAVRASDGMYRRQVDDIETQLCQPGELLGRGCEGPVHAGGGPLRAREHLVPGAEARPFAVDPHP